MQLTEERLKSLRQHADEMAAFGWKDDAETIYALLAAHNAGAQEPNWNKARHLLAIAMSGFSSRPDRQRSADDAVRTIDAITESGMPLAWLRYAQPQPMPQTDAARDAVRLNALEADVEVCRHVNPDYWTSRRVGHPWGKIKHSTLRSAIDAEIERLDRTKGE